MFKSEFEEILRVVVVVGAIAGIAVVEIAAAEIAAVAVVADTFAVDAPLSLIASLDLRSSPVFARSSWSDRVARDY